MFDKNSQIHMKERLLKIQCLALFLLDFLYQKIFFFINTNIASRNCFVANASFHKESKFLSPIVCSYIFFSDIILSVSVWSRMNISFIVICIISYFLRVIPLELATFLWLRRLCYAFWATLCMIFLY